MERIAPLKDSTNSPLPWMAHEDAGHYWRVKDANRITVARGLYQQEAFAIIAGVNYHDRLIEALRGLMRANKGTPEDWQEIFRLEGDICAFLAEIEAQS